MAITRREVLRVGLASAGALAWPAGAVRAAEGVKMTNVASLPFTLHLVAHAGGYFEKEGAKVEYLVANAGARSAQMLAAGQAHYVLGDTSHPQRLAEQGKPAVVLFACDRRCSHGNLLVRKELYDAGLTSIEKIPAFQPKDGGKLRAGATAIGSGAWVYGNFILRSVPAGEGKTANDFVEWQGVGAESTALAALESGRIDIVSATPEAIIDTERQGTAKVIYDVTDDAAWNRLFKGPVGVVGSYALKTTTENLKDETQRYVTACYKASQWIKTASPKDIAEIIKPHHRALGIAPETIVPALDWFKKVWQYDLDYGRESFQNGMNVMQGIKGEKVFPYEQIVDLSFLQQVRSSAS